MMDAQSRPESGDGLHPKKLWHRTRRAANTLGPHQFAGAVRQPLDRMEAALDNDTPKALAQLWQQRAAQLALVPAPEVSGEQLPVTVIRLQRELYGLEVQYIREVAPARLITRMPRVPSWVVGVVTQRGQVVSVIDLQQFMGLTPQVSPDTTPAKQTYLVNVRAGAMEVALLVDEILGVDVIPIDQLHPLESAPHQFRIEFVRGVCRREEAQATDLLIVLNLPALLADKRLIINETV